MRFPSALAAIPALLIAFAATRTDAIKADPFWSVICTTPGEHFVMLAAAVPDGVHACGPEPTTFQELPVVGSGGDTTVALDVGYDPETARLCFVNRALTEAPVLRVGVGRRLTFTLQNTLHNSGARHERNCDIQLFGGTDGFCVTRPTFKAEPGPDSPYYPIEANQAHTADGTTNLHVHGFFVPPTPCSDEVLRTAIYPANWIAPVAPLQPCQTAPDTLTYSYDLPPDHPSGLYWYHTHRHGQAEQRNADGPGRRDRDRGRRRRVSPLDRRDRRGAGGQRHAAHRLPVRPTMRRPEPAFRRRPAHPAPAQPGGSARGGTGSRRRDVRRQQAVRARSARRRGGPGRRVRRGRHSNAGGVELWTLLLNGAAVPEEQNGHLPARQRAADQDDAARPAPDFPGRERGRQFLHRAAARAVAERRADHPAAGSVRA